MLSATKEPLPTTSKRVCGWSGVGLALPFSTDAAMVSGPRASFPSARIWSVRRPLKSVSPQALWLVWMSGVTMTPSGAGWRISSERAPGKKVRAFSRPLVTVVREYWVVAGVSGLPAMDCCGSAMTSTRGRTPHWASSPVSGSACAALLMGGSSRMAALPPLFR